MNWVTLFYDYPRCIQVRVVEKFTNMLQDLQKKVWIPSLEFPPSDALHFQVSFKYIFLLNGGV